MPQSQRFYQLIADEAHSLAQPLQRHRRLLLGAIHFHKDARRFSISRKQYLADGRQSNARITQLALDQDPDFVAQGVGHTLAAVLYIPILHKNGLGEERSNFLFYRLFPSSCGGLWG